LQLAKFKFGRPGLAGFQYGTPIAGLKLIAYSIRHRQKISCWAKQKCFWQQLL